MSFCLLERKNSSLIRQLDYTKNLLIEIKHFLKKFCYFCIPEKCWEEGLQNPEWSWYVQFQRAAQIELWTGQKAPLDVRRKEIKGDYPGRKWEGADGM